LILYAKKSQLVSLIVTLSDSMQREVSFEQESLSVELYRKVTGWFRYVIENHKNPKPVRADNIGSVNIHFLSPGTKKPNKIQF